MKNNSHSIEDLQNLFENQNDQWERQFDIGYYTRLVLRRRWFVILPLCLALVTGIYLIVKLPKKYQAETLIMIEPTREPGKYMQPNVSSKLESRIDNIKELILSRTNLLKIIDNFSMFSEPKYDDTSLDERVELMRECTAVDIVNDGRNHKADAFKITFRGEEPRKVMQVVNAMADLLIDQNLKGRESETYGTTELAAAMKLKQSGEKFRILEMAQLPEKPQSPNIRKLFLMCIVAGLGLGGGLLFLSEYLDNTVKKLDAVPKKLGIPLLAAVPRVDNPRDEHRRRLNNGLSIAAVFVCIALMALFAVVSILQ